MAAGAVLLVAWYTLSYLAHPALPGNNPDAPLGWWGWWDQSQSLKSSLALRAHDLSAGQHWYPLGYSLLGAPFTGLRTHLFYLVDLGSLLLAYAGFVSFTRRVARDVPHAAAWGCGLFLLSVLWDEAIGGQWVIPWNSSPAAAAAWGLLATAAAWRDGERRPVLLGLLAGAMPLIRPTEAPLAVICLVFVAFTTWREGGWRRLPWVALGLCLVLLPYAALHLRIYGAQPSEYMVMSRGIGSSFHDWGWKAYVLLADPYPWFLDGQGLLRRHPWVALGLAGLVPALLQPGARRLLAVALVAHLLVYIGYIDLLPTGLWRYHNVHYWKWAMPGYALLGWLMLRDLLRARDSRAFAFALTGLAAGALLSLLRLEPVPAPPGQPAKMLHWSGPSPGFDGSYFGRYGMRDAAGTITNISDFRAFPVPGGMRAVALRRDFEDGATWQPGHAPEGGVAEGEPARFRIQLRVGRPCWLLRCGPRPPNGLMPPPPY